MLFTTVNATIQNQIVSTEEQIRQLQEQLAQLQAHAQAIGSMEQAAQSALQQAQTAIAMIRQIAPDELNTFKDAVDALFEGEAIAQLPEVEETPTETDEPTPTEPENDTTTIDVNVTSDILSEVESDNSDNNSHNGNGNGHNSSLTYDDLIVIEKGQLNEVAKAKSLNYRCSHEQLVKNLVNAGVTREEVSDILNV